MTLMQWITPSLVSCMQFHHVRLSLEGAGSWWVRIKFRENPIRLINIQNLAQTWIIQIQLSCSGSVCKWNASTRATTINVNCSRFFYSKSTDDSTSVFHVATSISITFVWRNWQKARFARFFICFQTIFRFAISATHTARWRLNWFSWEIKKSKYASDRFGQTARERGRQRDPQQFNGKECVHFNQSI